ncbi:MAG TPA: universal stress protein [Candidatus Binatia bacterium]|jgi:nucleotide-binding universal stress UspA family protein
MKHVKKILAPTDLSDLSRAGVRYALETAALTGAEVVVYNVVGYSEAAPYYDVEYGYVGAYMPAVEDVVEEHRRHLEKFMRDNFAYLTAKVRVAEVVEVGTPYEKIVEKARAENADIIVLSTHGRTGLMHVLIGSVAERVVRMAECPVLTVRPFKTMTTVMAAAA